MRRIWRGEGPNMMGQNMKMMKVMRDLEPYNRK